LVDEKFDQLIEGLALRAQAGVIAPRFIYQWSLAGIREIANSQPKSTPYYQDFEQSLAPLSSITPEVKEELLAATEAEIANSVIPAYQKLVDTLTELLAQAPTDDGVWQYPNGEAYYQYTIRHHTSTEMTPEEIHELGLQELARVQSEMRIIFDELGYPQDESLPQLFERVIEDGGILYGDEIVAGYTQIIEDAKTTVQPYFDLQPKADVVVIGGPVGGYYVSPAADGSRPGAFYAAVDGSEPYFGMPSLAYHEAIPGHHTQVALAMEMSDLPNFRKGSHFTAYVEGWALYAERLMWEIGAYEDDPYGNLGRLQMEAFRAARLVVDTGIHAKQWDFDQAYDYLLENTGLDPGLVNFEIGRYIAWPGQALSYDIGMLKILELRQMAMDQLGDQFDIQNFHNLILGNSSMPLDVLEKVVLDYLAAK
jgi:uncharacterized protein (DUF885 family)